MHCSYRLTVRLWVGTLKQKKGETPLRQREKILVFPLPKTPQKCLGKGILNKRFGPERWQDWFQVFLKATKVARELSAQILITSSFEVSGTAEADIFITLLQNLNFQHTQILEKRTATETIGHLETALTVAEELNAQLIVVSSNFHYFRALWLCRNKNVKHIWVWGLPLPRELLTDLILSVVFPPIHILGMEKRFRQLIENRRKKGQI